MCWCCSAKWVLPKIIIGRFGNYLLLTFDLETSDTLSQSFRVFALCTPHLSAIENYSFLLCKQPLSMLKDYDNYANVSQISVFSRSNHIYPIFTVWSSQSPIYLLGPCSRALFNPFMPVFIY